MKTVKTSLLLIIAFLMFGSMNSFAQRGQRKGHPHKAVRAGVVAKPYRHKPATAVVIRSKYRPAKIIVYHPYWGPKYSFHRRWVYFPRYNFYWDNWRQCYFFWNGVIWVNQVTPPPVVVNVNLEKEKHHELKENEDDVDDVYQTNDSHKSEFKGDTLK